MFSVLGIRRLATMTSSDSALKRPPLPQKRKWYQSKWSIAAHMALVYVGVYAYVNSVVKSRIEDRDRSKMITAPNDDTFDSAAETTLEDIKVQADTPPAATATPAPEQDLNNRATFDALAKYYDNKIKWEEFITGMGVLRRFLMRHAQGDILELSVGTGRNLKYYPNVNKINSITFVDNSNEMLEQTIKKFESLSDKFTKGKSMFSFLSRNNTDSAQEVPTKFVNADTSNLYHIPNESFDTVIDTFGLCSVCPESKTEGSGVVKVLNEMARVCKKDGKVLLLEHGQAKAPWLNSSLDKKADSHFSSWGCWWNRDFEKLISKSNLEIEYINRWHFGSTYYIICRPKLNAAERSE
jgi:methyltransferase OMS1